MVAWGDTEGGLPADLEGKYRGVGYSAAPGNIPLGTELGHNLCREIGHFIKQSSCYFQAKTAQSHIHHNVMFNGPRAGVNFNDGLGGGDVVDHNVIFNMVRETHDNGKYLSINAGHYWQELLRYRFSDRALTVYLNIRAYQLLGSTTLFDYIVLKGA